MALISQALTTLSNVKAIAGIPAATTTDDALLELLINSASQTIAGYCDRIFGRSTYTEYIPATNRQKLLLRQWPIVAVSSVTNDNVPYVLNTDYRLDDQDKAQGNVYRETGWEGQYLVTGMTNDPVASKRIVSVSYTAGYYLPSDPNYVAGDPASLPFDISMVCTQMATDAYYMTKRGGYGNLKSLTEGGLSYTWGIDQSQYGSLSAGIADKYALTLNQYKRWYAA